MQTDWSNELILKFLELYASERVIWDPKDRHHKLKHKKHDAWRRIGASMDNISIQELKSKKNSLMATFRPLRKRKKASIRNGHDIYDIFQPVWFAYDLMESFLGEIYDGEEATNAEEELQQSETTIPPRSPLHSEVVPRASLPLQCEEKPPPPLTLHNERMPPPSAPPQEYTKKMERSAAIKTHGSRKRPSNTDLYLGEAKKKIDEGFDTLKHLLKGNGRVHEDECDAYAKLLAKKLRKYPERMRDRIMYKIDGLLLDIPYPEERPPSPGSSSWPSPNPYCQGDVPSPAYIIPLSPGRVNVPEEDDTRQNRNNTPRTLQSPVETSATEMNRSGTTSVNHDIAANLELQLTTGEPDSDHEMTSVPKIRMKQEIISDPEDAQSDWPEPDVYSPTTLAVTASCSGAALPFTPILSSVTSLSKPSTGSSESGEILGVPVTPARARSPTSMSSSVSEVATNSGLEKCLAPPHSTVPTKDPELDPKLVLGYKTRRDQFDVYGEYIASKLRRLDWRTCAHVQKAFGDIIFEAEMGKYSQRKDYANSAVGS